MAAAVYFLKLDGIAGESVDAKHKGEIELEAFSWGETQAVAASGGGGGAGKVRMQDLNVAMKLNRASPLLLLACATGQHLKAAVLSARRPGKDPFEFLVLRLNDVVVSAYA